MSTLKKTPKIDTKRIDEEIISPEDYLNLTDKEKLEIEEVMPFVEKIGKINLDDANFVGMKVRYKNPRYIVKF